MPVFLCKTNKLAQLTVNLTIKFFRYIGILAINTHSGNKLAYSIDPQGGYMQLRSFEFGDDTEVFLSCSLQWKNQYYVFGGLNEKTQVSMVIDFRLERKGRLAFNFDIGGCTVLEQLIIVLCFTDKEGKLCRQSKTPMVGINFIQPFKTRYFRHIHCYWR